VALPALGQLFKFARDTQDLYKLHETVKETLAALVGRLRVVEDRLIRMEAEQGQLVSEAKSAATGAATMIASAVISDAVTRVTRVEEGVRRLLGLNGAMALHDGSDLRRTM
jgi:phage shock protein A